MTRCRKSRVAAKRPEADSDIARLQLPGERMCLRCRQCLKSLHCGTRLCTRCTEQVADLP